MVVFALFLVEIVVRTLINTLFALSARTLGLHAQQFVFRKHQIGQPKQAEHLRFVLGQALVARLLVLEQVLDHMERMLHSGSNLCLHVLQLLDQLLEWPLRHRLDRAALGRHVPLDGRADLAGLLRLGDLFALFHPDVASVGKHFCLLPVQHFVRVGNVTLVGGRDVQAVNQARLGIGANVGLHAEVPLVALLGLMHLGVARLVLVLRRGRSFDDGRVNHRALAQQQPTLAQVGVDLGKHLLGQRVFFQQAAKLQQRRRIGHLLPAKVDAQKISHRLAVVDGVFQSFVAQAEPLLQKVHAQHQRDAQRRAAHAPAPRVVRLDQRLKLGKRHHLVHLAQELLPPRDSLLACEFGAGKADLLQVVIAVFHGSSA